MINKNTIVVIIPARNGSKRLKNSKNILKINTKPMVIRCAMEAAKSKYVDHIYVSSESKKF